MPPKREQRVTLRAQWLGRMLRQLREQNNLTLKEAGEYLQKDFSTVSRFELGTFPVRRGDLLALMDLYAVDDKAQRETLLNLCGEVWQTGWWDKYSSDDVWGSTIDLVWLESRAETIRMFAALSVPGLLQIPEYAHALISVVDNDVSTDQVDRWVELRIDRQKVLHGDHLQGYTVLLDESSLLRVVGGPTVMAKQLSHLRRMAESERITIRILPFAIGAHPSPEGAFTLLDLGNPFSTVAHIESRGGGIYLERGEVDKLVDVYDRLREMSLSPEDSVAFIAALERNQ
ncbi:helix-turn-helix domain-containing protein [Nocardiopsis alborubida]|uniref:Helix-turn-helix domain-containing protein n=1 Tax=Nocardiopsis alborubida TaxID=146802 RepID=A0A7X6RQB0_9ACTN|nr:helix-turn-helix transcriptional regulator [Nocardiopsis alborubida]NKY98032.1 helix-turn-helix domain-containing protein [Nocardiopsis alborubida]